MSARQTDWRAAAGAVREAKTEAVRQAAAMVRPAWEADAVLTYSGMVAANLAPREKEVSVAKAKAGDRVQIFRSGRAALATGGEGAAVPGVSVESHAFVYDNGRVVIVHVIPAVADNQTLTIPLKLLGYRPAG